ncbi:ATP-binding protein [Glycomyces tenuis]|uniref:ATP-binding protein n=1 Tax=Glycomyces tenuis TaxID=58116 RepID=UPI0004260F12|nr:ATP-binding protein [Glycomyces tenuis]
MEFEGLLTELGTVVQHKLRFDLDQIEMVGDADVDRFDNLRRQVRESTDLKIVHVVGHGEIDRDGFLHLIPPSGLTDDRTILQNLCAVAQSACAQSEDREMLLVIDVCQAGAAVDRLGLEQLDHVWIAAAATPSQPTYDGVFTRAFTATLNDIAAGRTNTDPGEAYVSMQTFRDMFGTHLRRFGVDTGTYGPRPKLVGKFSAIPDPSSKIFRNRNYDDKVASRRDSRSKFDPALHEYLDDGLDVEHFDNRVGAHFTGRRTVLRELGSWFTDTGGRSNLAIVTGSGGVGKSAVLGAIVLTQHPQIIENPEYGQLGRALRKQYPAALNYARLPFPIAAVHARQMRIEQVTASITKQLARQLRPGAMPDEPTPDGLIAALKALDEPPLLLVDALDEAIGPEQIADTLLRGLLQQAKRDDGRPVCRLLIACRNETTAQKQLLTRLQTASTEPTPHDLDRTPTDELHVDLSEFMHKALEPPTGGITLNAKRIAEATADTLAGSAEDDESAAHRDIGYGAFLVAKLYARHLQRTGLLDRPEQALATIPRTLPQVLEMDLLESHYEYSSLDRRSVLAALAHARGEGMPASIAGLLAVKVFNGGDDLDTAALLRSTDIKIYLRTSVDPDSGETLYRLFHQSLVDHLLAHPRKPAETEIVN